MKTSKKHEVTQINSNLQSKIRGQLRFFILEAIPPEVVSCHLFSGTAANEKGSASNLATDFIWGFSKRTT